MKKNVYAQLELSPSSEYISVREVISENYISEAYEDMKQFAFKMDGANKKVECFEGYKLTFVHLEVTFDGRRGLKEDDILKSLESKGLAEYKGSNIFGSLYLPSEKLKNILDEQFAKRKELVQMGVYEYTA
ncbi:hypothetical protein [Bacillus sp. UMB0728]|uniref:hypothetical protein n=1 Tax=Bacillus sp. UMB0728 TaxID=2066052 RepID=UPI000C783B92|nr:hypothetical protein [Bacillus sp. UMB0728]PLR72280.1 hypothetical protein CYJ37_12040 [Bacillus sp. UMB0728]